MKKLLVLLFILPFLASCTIHKGLWNYYPDEETIEIVQSHIEEPINIGDFYDASYRTELSCRTTAILEAPDDNEFKDIMRHALIDELKQANRYDENAPVTIRGLLNRIDVDTNKGAWIIRMSFKSSNGKQMTIEEERVYGSLPTSEVACTQAAFHYLPLLKSFMKKLLASPEFAELAKNTPPEAREEVTQILSDEEEAKAEEEARLIGKERIRQGDSLEGTRKIPAN